MINIPPSTTKKELKELLALANSEIKEWQKFRKLVKKVMKEKVLVCHKCKKPIKGEFAFNGKYWCAKCKEENTMERIDKYSKKN